MECRPLDINLISAEGIKDVNTFTTMDVYTVVSIDGDHRTKHKSPVDKHAGTSPKWNHPIKFTLEESSISQRSLLFEIKSERALGDKEIGDVSVPIRELLDSAAAAASAEGGHKEKDVNVAAVDGGEKEKEVNIAAVCGGEKEKDVTVAAAPERVVSYPVRCVSGKQKGTLTFSYKFGEKFTQAVAENPLEKFVQMRGEYPVTAYPPPGNAGAGPSYQPPPPAGYPMQQPGMMSPHAYSVGVGYPPPGYGGYPAQHYGGPGYPPAGYGYPPPPQQGYMMQPPEQKKKKMGGNLGLGIGAGLLGGLLVADMIGDVGEMAAYDAGYDDAMGGDF